MKRLFFNYYLLIIIVVLLARFVAIPVIEYFAAAPFKQDFINYYQELTRGSYHLVSRYLQQYPENEWPQRLSELEPHFGYPLETEALDAASFTSLEYQQLQAGEIIVGTSFDQFWQRIGGSDRVLVMGPFPSPGVGRSVDILVWGMVLLLLSCVVFLWTVPFWRKLKQISHRAAEFGEGNLAARVHVPRRSALAPLADTFNRMADQIQQLINSQKALTNAVSHELRTPLFRMRLGMEMLVTAADESKKERYVKGIYRDLDEMGTLVTELLTYARFDSGMFELQLEEIELSSWLEREVAELAAELEVKLWLARDSSVERGKICADSGLLHRAFSNLVHNASKYGDGQVKVTLQLSETEVAIHIDDNGPGIVPEERERIFEPFTRLDSSRNRESGGYGLGLAIVRQIMTLHRGTVTVSDASLGGSRFTMSFQRQK